MSNDLDTDSAPKPENLFITLMENAAKAREQGRTSYAAKRPELLTSKYIPSEFPHREKQISDMVAHLSPILKGTAPEMLFVRGGNGTGKTHVTTHVLDMLVEASEKYNASFTQGLVPVGVRYSYTNARRISSEHNLIGITCQNIIGKDFVYSGYRLNELYDILTNVLKKEGHPHVIIIDEIDKLVKKDGADFIYNLDQLNTDERYHIPPLAIIGITNNYATLEKCFEDCAVESRISSAEPVDFTPYNAQHVRDILTERAKNNLDSEVGAISLIAAQSTQDKPGDARHAIKILNKACELTGRYYREHSSEKQEYTLTNDFAQMASEQVSGDIRTINNILDLDLHSAGMLFSLYLLGEEFSTYEWDTGSIYNTYEKLMNLCVKVPLTQRRISDKISEQNAAGRLRQIITTKGRYGRTKMATLTMDRVLFRKAMLKHEDLESILTAHEASKKGSNILNILPEKNPQVNDWGY
ncbi:AAA family ATPase [Candidatus Woesearchaeota archaeon]|jgi:archaeal cell division control protein 6|nr:AAA family ATPase [Candidatus Woesearchaeota archaeon]MBT4248117.1 AAA family ATPase [Candidatus Woesearchaeota archaeon]